MADERAAGNGGGGRGMVWRALLNQSISGARANVEFTGISPTLAPALSEFILSAVSSGSTHPLA
jgi:hypothetical protein